MRAMPVSVFVAVVVAAALHAGWNALLKICLDRFLTICLIQMASGLLALPGLLFVPMPELEAWPWLMASAGFHIGYNVFLARAYRYGDLGQVYPLARGTSPLLIALVGVVVLDEHLSWVASVGLIGLVAGIWLMALRGGRTRGPVDFALVGCAVITAAFICAYTLSDALGARANGAAVAYSLWLFAVNGVVMAIVLTILRGPRVFIALRGHWCAGLGGGAMSLGAYTIAIWAMTRAPVAMVSGLRETSVLFAVLIGAVILKEPLRAGRLVACAMILAGVATMRLG